MECYCREIPKCQNDMRVIRRAMGYFENSADQDKNKQAESIIEEEALLQRFTKELISRCQQELNRLEMIVTEMEEHDGWYHQQEADHSRISQC